MDPPAPSDLLLAVSETTRIINGHSRHFLFLSVLFLLPLSSLLLLLPAVLLPSLRRPFPVTVQTLLHSSFSSHLPPPYLSLLYLAYAVLLLVPALSAAATISHSVLDGFFGRPVRLAASLRTLPSALARLAATFACAAFVLYALAALLFAAGFLGFKTISLLGLLKIPLPSLPVVSVIVAAILVLVGLYLSSRWAIFPAVVVAEHSWGLAALRRADYLLPGFRTSAAVLVAVPAGAIAGMVWAASLAVERDPGGRAAVVAVTIAGLVAMIVLMLYGLATSAMMYMYCKAARGELAAEIAAEFGRDYVFLPFDGQKVPHMVTVVRS